MNSSLCQKNDADSIFYICLILLRKAFNSFPGYNVIAFPNSRRIAVLSSCNARIGNMMSENVDTNVRV